MFDRRHEFVNNWLLWIVLHAIGSTLGVLYGEILGYYAAQRWTQTAGHLTAFLVFEIAIWLPRRMLFHHFMLNKPSVRLIQWSWLATEVVGWMIGTQLSQNVRNPHFADGAAFGALLSAIMWFLLWCMQRAPYGRWWIVTALLCALAGFIASNIIVTVTLVLNSELHAAFPQPPFAWIAIVLTGVLAGLTIGGLTGLLVAGLRASPAAPLMHSRSS